MLRLRTRPATLHRTFTAAYLLDELIARLQAIAAPETASILPRVLRASRFVGEVFDRQREWAEQQLSSGAFERLAPPLSERLDQALESALDDASWMRELRRFRNREMARLSVRDIAGWAALDETLIGLSNLADEAVTRAVDRVFAQLCQRYGEPRSNANMTAKPIVIGMGKLGGRELNFSSDIDLIFAFTAAGESDGANSISNEEFFGRLVQQTARLLSERTSDGFVFRVDTLLRPFGSVGAPAISADAMENYYQTHGREWERYALIKARPVAGDLTAGADLLKTLQPFIYRRYLDYNAVGSLRELKHLIDIEAGKRGAEDDLKLGPGGIRELEFIVQLFQLIRGGQNVRLRDTRLRPVLQTLKGGGQLSEETVQALDAAYVFLRRCENAIQLYADEQTHRLPVNEAPRQALCAALDFADWSALKAALEMHRGRVRIEFERLFAVPDTAGSDTSQATTEGLWSGGAEAVSAALRVLGFKDDIAAVVSAIDALRASRLVRALSDSAQTRLQAVVVRLAQVSSKLDAPGTAFIRSLGIISSLAGRGNYLGLLRDSVTARTQLVRLAAASPWIANLLAQTPALLDALLDERLANEAPDREALHNELQARSKLTRGDAGIDTEAQMELLRRYRQEMTLRIAATDLAGSLPLVQVSDRLTWLAEAIVTQTLVFAHGHLQTPFGKPCRDDGSPAEFAILAYGKFGSVELGYGSDLDLVFVHDADADAVTQGGIRSIASADYFSRLAQRMVMLLSTLTGAGRAYEIDLELRPSGNSGLVVTSLGGFARYQRESAWTWEHQALLRARPVAGDTGLRNRLEAIRREVLTRPHEAGKLRQDVLDMRTRMRMSLQKHIEGRWDVKQAPGGLIDAEFLTQYLCLRGAALEPRLIDFTDNWRQLDALASCGQIDPDDQAALLQAERSYRGFLHRRSLQQQDTTADQAQFAPERAAVVALWKHLLEDSPT